MYAGGRMTDVRDACYARVMDTFPTSSAEWQTRADLAACYQLCALYGWDDGIYTHICYRKCEHPYSSFSSCPEPSY
jgi:hypothetical protein